MTTALILFIYFCTVSAFWRLPCPRQIGLARVDPLVAPGGISGHVHTIHGGNSKSKHTCSILSEGSAESVWTFRLLSRHLDFGINATPDDLLASKCTSCAIDKDLSAYWTPPLYFQHANGTFQKVPQVGGMLA